jgi:hypothetical protein
MKFPLLFGFLSTLLPAATLTLSPAVAYECSNNDAVLTATWSGASGPVQVHVIKPDGPAFTALSDPSGSAMTGPWVTDGMQFFLVNQNGGVEATATATVRCGSTVRTIETGLAGGSYFPLQLGNTWVYRSNSRVITNDYVIRTITGTQVVSGITYFVLTEQSVNPSTTLLRGDNNGVIHVLNGGVDQVFLDPSNQATGPFFGVLGVFNNTITVPQNSGQVQRSLTYARGIGLVGLSEQLLAGSSGGFSQSLDLIEARIDGITLSLPTSRLSVSFESPVFDLTNQKAPNCAVPLYCVACGLLGADPPGTYRPCVQTRLESSYSGPHSLQLQFFNGSGTLVYDTTVTVDGTGTLRYLRLPLYTSPTAAGPFQILPTGLYKLVGRMIASGAEVGVDSVQVLLQ